MHRIFFREDNNTTRWSKKKSYPRFLYYICFKRYSHCKKYYQGSYAVSLFSQSMLLSHLIVTYYWVTQKLPQIYTANHATFAIRIRKITVQICGNFLVTQYIPCVQEVVTPIYIMSYYINWGNYFLDTWYILGDQEVTGNLYCNFAYPYWEGSVICSIYLR